MSDYAQQTNFQEKTRRRLTTLTDFTYFDIEKEIFMRRFNVNRRIALLLIGSLCGFLLVGSVGYAQSFGMHWQSNNFNFGPWFVTDFGTGSAWGVNGDDWYGTYYASSFIDPNSSESVVPFQSPSMNGATVNLSWSSSNTTSAPAARAYPAYGWSHANMPSPGLGSPESGEEATLAAFVYSIYDPVSQQGSKIVVNIDNLQAVADASGVPLQYKVKVLASSEWDAMAYTPALIEDSASNSELVQFNVLPTHPIWNDTLVSSGATGDTTSIFTGDSVTITVAGPNGFDIGNGQAGRSSLSGVAIYFVPPAAAESIVPEPSSVVLIVLASIALLFVAIRSRRGELDGALAKLVLKVTGLGYRRLFARIACVFGLLISLQNMSLAAPSFGINFDNDYFNGTTVASFPSAFGVAGTDWYSTLYAVSGDAPTSDANGVVQYSAPSMGGASVNLKWSSDRIWFSNPSPVYGFTHANTDPNDPTGQTGLAGAGAPLTGEEAVLKGSLVGTYVPSTGVGDKIQVSISGLGAVATAAGVPLQYRVKVMGSDWGLPRSFLLPPTGATNPAPGYFVQNFFPATVTDNASNSETVALSTLWPDHPAWNPPPIDAQGPYYSSAATGDSTTVFTGDTLTITLGGPFDYGGAWGTANYGVTRLAGVAIEFVNPGQAGDFDGDGDVDGADFVVWQTHFPTTSGALPEHGDADGDMDVDGADFAAWQSAFPGGAGSSPVPEPSAILLMAFGALAIGKWRFSRS